LPEQSESEKLISDITAAIESFEANTELVVVGIDIKRPYLEQCQSDPWSSSYALRVKVHLAYEGPYSVRRDE